MQKLTWQLQEGLVKFTGGSLVAAAGHPQALVDAVRLSLGLPLPFNHESSGDSGSETEQWQEETEELQSRAGHRVQITAGRVRWISNEVRELGFESGPGKKPKTKKTFRSCWSRQSLIWKWYPCLFAALQIRYARAPLQPLAYLNARDACAHEVTTPPAADDAEYIAPVIILR